MTATEEKMNSGIREKELREVCPRSARTSTDEEIKTVRSERSPKPEDSRAGSDAT